MVNPRRTPENIIRSIFVNESDYNDFVKHLGTCQKTHAEWDHYRQKIPDDLLAKFKMLLEACRENGFIGPRIIDGKMVFSQVLSKKRNRKESDQCTMCPNNIVSKTCKGRMFYNSKFQKIFEPCWTAMGLSAREQAQKEVE